jgi:YVTN family beta-propeller protein
VTSARTSGQRRFRIVVIAASVVVAFAGAVLLATRDTGERVTTRGVTATKTLADRPGAVAAGENALWVGVADPKRPLRKQPMYRLELASDDVTRSIDIGGQASFLLRAGATLYASVEHEGGDGAGPSRLDAFDWRTGELKLSRPYAGLLGPLARDGNTLWVLQTRPGLLIQVDADTLMPTKSPLELRPGRNLGLAVGAGYVWVAAADAGEVLRIDPATGTITPLHVGGFPVAIAVAGGSVWFADRKAGTVTRLDPRRLRPIGDPIRVGSQPSSLAVAGGALLVGRPESGTVTRIDVRSGRKAGVPIRFAPPADTHAFALTPAGASVWASSFASMTLTRISSTGRGAAVPAATVSKALLEVPGQGPFPRGARVTATIHVPPWPPQTSALAIGEGAVWSLNSSSRTLLRIDPKSNSVVKRIAIHAYGDIAVGAGSIWLTDPAANTVDRMDAKTSRVLATIPVGRNPLTVAVTPRAVWVANSGLAAPDIPSVSRIDPTTNEVVATIPLGPATACCAPHMGVIAADGAVWTDVPQANLAVRIDPATNAKTVVKLTFPPCAYLAADETAVWSTAGGCADVVGRVDLRTHAATKLTEAHPVGLALAFGRVWVASLAAGTVDQLDRLTNRVVARLPVGGVPIQLAVGFGSVWVLDGTGRILRIQPTH